MEKTKISKRCYLGERLSDLNELLELARDKKSIAYSPGNDKYLKPIWFIRPASWMVHWSLAKLANTVLYKVEKIK